MPILDYEPPRNRPPRIDPLFVTLAALIVAPTVAFVFVGFNEPATRKEHIASVVVTIGTLALCLAVLWWVLSSLKR